MSREVSFEENEDSREKLDKLRIGGVLYSEDDVKIGPQGGRFIIKDGKKTYLSDVKRGKKTEKTAPRKPSKVSLSKYEAHPLAQSINGIMALICQGVNRTILAEKKQFSEKDIKNIKMGEAWVYWVEQRAKISSTQPELVVLSAFGGFFGRMAVLSMGGVGGKKKPKIVANLEEGGILNQ